MELVSRPLRARGTFFLWIYFWATFVIGVSSQSYQLDTEYSGASFFNGWDFYADDDPTHGFVTYLDQTSAAAAGLISSAAGQPAYMGVDHATILPTNGRGRSSVRISSQKSWTHGLFIGDLAHMPGSICGTWPAFWTLGPNWPNGGEVDIIEGVHDNTENVISLHTGANCVMTAGTQSGTVNGMQCDVSLTSNSGCSSHSNNQTSYGDGFNNIGGGIYATEWTSEYIKVWFFPRNNIPHDITNGAPDPKTWNSPQASFIGASGCNLDTHFMNHNIIFDTTFCGDWAGNVWIYDSACSALASSCIDYVAGNPAAFQNSYWSVNSVKVYQLGTIAVSSSSSSSTTSTTSLVASSSTTASTSSSQLSTASSSSQLSTFTSSSSIPTTSQTTTSTTSTIYSSSSPSATPSGWTPLGCYTDNVATRSLPVALGVPGGPQAMTNELCKAACQAAGYIYAGTEYAGECYCGNAIQNGGVPAPDGNALCSMTCHGDATEICGGPNRLSLFRYSVPSSSPSTTLSDSLVSTSSTTTSSTSSTTTTSTSTVVSSSSTTSTSSSAVATGWSLLGCYTDNVGARSLSVAMGVAGGPSKMTVELCQIACQSAGYLLAGVEYAQECYCDNVLRNGGAIAPDGNALCNMACNGNAQESCGGPNRLNLFAYEVAAISTSVSIISAQTSSTTTFSSLSTTTSMTSLSASTTSLTASLVLTSTTTGLTPPSTGWSFLGCYTDNVGARSLSIPMGVPGGPGQMTITLCQTACQLAGYVLAGLEYAQECYCDNTLRNGGAIAPDGNALCNMACNGNTQETCGGPNRLNLYSLAAASAPSTSTTLSATTFQTSVSTSSATSTTTSATVTATASHPGWTPLGCFTDNVGARTLSVGAAVPGGANAMTIELCVAACQQGGYVLAGVEYARECYCDNVLRNGGALAPDGDQFCNMPCLGNGGEICGGPNRLDLLRYNG